VQSVALLPQSPPALCPKDSFGEKLLHLPTYRLKKIREEETECDDEGGGTLKMV
jgi:hypothetical protein